MSRTRPWRSSPVGAYRRSVDAGTDQAFAVARGYPPASGVSIVFFSRGSAGNCCVTQECFDNLFAHGENWVEAGHRILEDHRDVASASLSEFFCRKLEKIVFPEKDFPVQDFTWRLRYQP